MGQNEVDELFIWGGGEGESEVARTVVGGTIVGQIRVLIGPQMKMG